MTTKEAILEEIRHMPDNVTREEVLDNLAGGFAPEGEGETDEEYANYVRREIEIGLRQIENGEGIPHEEIKRRLPRWFS